MTGEAARHGRGTLKRAFESLVTLLVIVGAPTLLWVVMAHTEPAPPMTARERSEWWLAVLKADQGRR